MVGTADSSFLNVGALVKVEKHQQNYAAGGVDGLVLTVSAAADVCCFFLKKK